MNLSHYIGIFKCRNIITFQLLLLCLCISCVGHATELKLDEQVPVSQLSKPAVSDDVSKVSKVEKLEYLPIQSDAQEKVRYWWLLIICMFFLVVAGGIIYWLGYKKNERKEPLDIQPTDLEGVESAVLRAAAIRKLVKESQAKTELSSEGYVSSSDASNIFRHEDLKKAYKYHKIGKQKKVMEIMNLAFRYDAFDFSIYAMSMRILAESDKGFPELERLLKTGLFLLRTKRPVLWKEVALKGNHLLPDLEDWGWKPES